MTDRQKTIVCAFDQRSPRITAHHKHEWIHEKLRLEEDEISMIQIDGPRRQVFIKFTNGVRMHRLLQDTAGTQEIKHDTGELSQVHISIAGMGFQQVRIDNLPPEVPDRTIRDNLAKYGEVKDIKEELWTKAFGYKVSNGIQIVEMNLKLHLPSHMIIAGHRVLVSYDGQPSTCYACNESGHQYQDCPNRKRRVPPEKISCTSTWADVVMQNTRNTRLAMLQHTTETLPGTCSEGTQTTVNMPPVMEQTL